RTDVVVDVRAVRICSDDVHVRTGQPVDLRCDVAGRTVRAIDHNTQAVQRGHRVEEELDVAVFGIDDVGDLRGRILIAVHRSLDLVLDRIGKLHPVRTEVLDAV